MTWLGTAVGESKGDGGMVILENLWVLIWKNIGVIDNFVVMEWPDEALYS